MKSFKEVTCVMPIELAQKLEVDAKKEGISQSEYVRRAIANYLICKAPQRLYVEGSVTIKHETL